MSTRTELDPINEGDTGKVTFTLEDEAGDPVALSAIGTFVLDLYVERTQATINSRAAQNVLNANNVTVAATSGLVTWTVQPGDTPFVGADSGALERHIARFTAVWSSSTKRVTHEIVMPIRNVRRFSVS